MKRFGPMIGSVYPLTFAVLATLICVGWWAPVCIAGTEPYAPLSLLDVQLHPESAAVGDLVASGEDILGLSADHRENVVRWIRLGGRLWLVGEAADFALQSIAPGRTRNVDDERMLGLGTVAVLEEDFPPEPPLFPACMEVIPESAIELAATGLPERAGLHHGTAVLLAFYAMLLIPAALFTRAFPRFWRRAGIFALVVVFGSWPVLNIYISWKVDRWNQVDVVVDVGSGPELVCSAAVIRPGARRQMTLQVGDGAWNPRRFTRANHAPTELLILAGESGMALPSIRIESTRGSRVDISWLADGGLGGGWQTEIRRSAGEVSGLVRNGLALDWTDFWLLVPGTHALRLDDLPAHEARVFASKETAASTIRNALQDLTRDLSREKCRLLEAAYEGVITPLLEREMSVFVAWSDQPARAALDESIGERSEGATLYISASRLVS